MSTRLPHWLPDIVDEGVDEVALDVLCSDSSPGFFKGLFHRVCALGALASDERLELGPELLDGVEVGLEQRMITSLANTAEYHV